jgi:hypothetical protein
VRIVRRQIFCAKQRAAWSFPAAPPAK